MLKRLLVRWGFTAQREMMTLRKEETNEKVQKEKSS